MPDLGVLQTLEHSHLQ